MDAGHERREERRRERRGERRLVHDGDTYTVDEDAYLELPERRPEPDVNIQGEPWGWTKGPPYPKGWREDGQYGTWRREDPGPYDGSWSPPERSGQ